MLDEAARHHPDSWWWLKADGCDVITELSKSTRGVWSGDVDWNDGALQDQFKLYKDRLSRVTDIKLSNDRERLLRQLAAIAHELQEDLVYLHTGIYSTCILLSK